MRKAIVLSLALLFYVAEYPAVYCGDESSRTLQSLGEVGSSYEEFRADTPAFKPVSASLAGPVFGRQTKDYIFRQYDIRGVVGDELVVDESYEMAQAIITYFKQQRDRVKKVVVGGDGRVSTPAIKQHVINGIRDMGVDVIDVGMCPSPVVYFCLHTVPDVDGSVMITASHNGPEYNGIKINLGPQSLWGDQIYAIRDIFKEQAPIKAEKQGDLSYYNANEAYVQWFKDNFSHLVGMELSIVIDCGNGAAGTVVPRLLEVMEWKNVDLLYPDVDGTYPNHQADPIVEKNMVDLKKAIMAGPYVFGMGLDGDCDRMAALTKSGELVVGDKLLALFAQEIVKSISALKVVLDVTCSSALADLLKEWGAQPIYSPCGHSIIQGIMERHEAQLGGEMSCHFTFKDRYFDYDDGIYAAVRLIEIMHNATQSLDEMLKIYPKRYSSFQYRIACDEDKKVLIVNEIMAKYLARSDVETVTIDGVRVIKKDSWAIVRASNTQPVLVVRFEGNTAEALDEIKKEFIEALSVYYDREFLEKEFSV